MWITRLIILISFLFVACEKEESEPQEQSNSEQQNHAYLCVDAYSIEVDYQINYYSDSSTYDSSETTGGDFGKKLTDKVIVRAIQQTMIGVIGLGKKLK